MCGVRVGHTGPKGFGHRRGNTWTHTTVRFNGFCTPNLKLGTFFKLESMLKLSGIKQECITLATFNKYLRLKGIEAFFITTITKNMVVCVITGQVKRQPAHGNLCF